MEGCIDFLCLRARLKSFEKFCCCLSSISSGCYQSYTEEGEKVEEKERKENKTKKGKRKKAKAEKKARKIEREREEMVMRMKVERTKMRKLEANDAEHKTEGESE